jgi:hypothetical protein
VEYQYTMRSTDGPLESAKIRCPRGHCFNGPLESLLWDQALASASQPRIRSQDAASRGQADPASQPDGPRSARKLNVMSMICNKVRTIYT